MANASDDTEPTLRRLVEPTLLGAAFLLLLALWGLAELADEVIEGETRAVDHRILEYVRTQWVVSEESTVAEIAENITALGGIPVLALVLASILGYMLLRRDFAHALYVAVVTVGGLLISLGLKSLFDRPRPTLVEPLEPVATASFPSGHSMISAFVYLTLAVLIVADEERRAVKLYVLGIALVFTGLVGLSRIFLGVHFPTDVLAGWMAGLAWAIICWIGYVLLGRP